MGNPTGFIYNQRKNSYKISEKDRINNFDEFHEALREEERLLQASRCMDCGVPFCQAGLDIGGTTIGCPLNNLIPEWNDLLYKGNYKEAYLRLIKTNNFPEFTSRVCPALCEKACTLGESYEAVSTRENELSIIEKAYAMGYAAPKPPKSRTDKRIAIVGSGPSGLAAADQLNKRGHNVTVYERSENIGGLLVNGIPNMKLDKGIVKRKLDVLAEEGINFISKINVGKDISVSTLQKNYDAVILAIGATKPRDIKVKGRNGTDIFFAVDFLTDINNLLQAEHLDTVKHIQKKKINNKKVVIIGGGDTRNDCVATSVRLGAKAIVQLEMLEKPPIERAESNPWPQWPKVLKTDYGQEEAIYKYGKDPRIFSTTVDEFIRDDKGKLTGAKTIKVSRDNNGSFVNLKDTEKIINCDIALIAAGFLGPEEYLLTSAKINMPSKDFQTNKGNIFMTGDARTGQSIVVKAISDGRKVASIVDEKLMGYTNL